MSASTTTSTTTGREAPLRVAVIVGSVREGRQGRAVTDWFLGAAASTTTTCPSTSSTSPTSTCRS